MSLNSAMYPLELREVMEPITAISTPARQGMTSFVTFAETAVGSVVVKQAVNHRLESLRREHRVLEALDTVSLPFIPKPVRFLERITAEGQAGWLVMQRLVGIPLQQVFRADERHDVPIHLLHNLGKRIAQLHAVPAPPPLHGPGQNWLAHMLAQAALNLSLGIGEGSRELLEQLNHKRPVPVSPVLIHGDLFFDNILTNGEEVTGLIDWAFGAVGDPRYDLAVATYGLSLQEKQAFLEGYGERGDLTELEADYFRKLATFY